jgi:hypothetical protein
LNIVLKCGVGHWKAPHAPLKRRRCLPHMLTTFLFNFFFNLCKYQIAPKPTLLKKNIIKRPKKLSILVVDHFSQPDPTCQIVSALGLTALMDLFLMTTHSPKTCLTSQQPTLLIRPTTKSSLADIEYYRIKKKKCWCV